MEEDNAQSDAGCSLELASIFATCAPGPDRQNDPPSDKPDQDQATGKAKLYSYVINHRPAAPGFTPPYAIAVVELDEGPRMMSNIVDCPQTPEALVLDMKLEVAFEKLDDKITLPNFRPAKG